MEATNTKGTRDQSTIALPIRRNNEGFKSNYNLEEMGSRIVFRFSDAHL
jgi:hypothetical protein